MSDAPKLPPKPNFAYDAIDALLMLVPMATLFVLAEWLLKLAAVETPRVYLNMIGGGVLAIGLSGPVLRRRYFGGSIPEVQHQLKLLGVVGLFCVVAGYATVALGGFSLLSLHTEAPLMTVDPYVPGKPMMIWDDASCSIIMDDSAFGSAGKEIVDAFAAKLRPLEPDAGVVKNCTPPSGVPTREDWAKTVAAAKVSHDQYVAEMEGYERKARAERRTQAFNIIGFGALAFLLGAGADWFRTRTDRRVAADAKKE